MHIGDDMPVFVWNYLRRSIPGEHLLTVDDARNLNDLSHLLVQFGLQRRSF